MKRSAFFFPFLWVFACLIGIQSGSAQTPRPRLDQGITLYRAGQWTEAARELRRIQRELTNPGQQAEALYWISRAEFSLGEYETALRDINEVQRIAPAGLRIDDILFYKGRTLYYMKNYEEALAQLRAYGNILSYQNTPEANVKKSELAYWIGECLYALGWQDEAAAQFTLAANSRPWSEKHEAAVYRLALIQQNKTQAELLDMLNLSYTEYLQTVEEYQYRLAEAETQIRDLETSLSSVAKAVGTERSNPAASAPSSDPGPEHTIQRIREQKAAAEKLRNELAALGD